jgi:hypothetical protein
MGEVARTSGGRVRKRSRQLRMRQEQKAET